MYSELDSSTVLIFETNILRVSPVKILYKFQYNSSILLLPGLLVQGPAVARVIGPAVARVIGPAVTRVIGPAVARVIGPTVARVK